MKLKGGITSKMWAILLCLMSTSGFSLVLALDIVSSCSPGMFRPEVDGDCKPCSVCPEQQIVRETCWENRDTVCGSFTGSFNFKNSNTLKVVHKDATTRRDNLRRSQPEVASDTEDEWHTITMVTIGVLSVSAVLFSIFIIVTCYKCRHQYKDSLITQVDRDSDFEKAEPDVRHPVPSTSGNTTATSSVDMSFKSIEQFEIAVDSPK